MPTRKNIIKLLEHCKGGSFDKAEELASSIISEFPNNQFVWKILGAVLGQTGRILEAIDANQKSIDLAPEDPEAHNNLGNMLREIGRLDEAEASYIKALALKPDFAEAYNNLGVTLKELGRFKEAEASYKKSLAFKPQYPEARYNLGVRLFESKEYEIAAEQFAQCNSFKSNLYAIKCAFLLDEEEIFLKKFETLVSQGVVNPVIGSLSSNYEKRYGVKNLNPFCNDPLKYVTLTNLFERCDFDNIFINTSRSILEYDLVSKKAQGHLTNGIQTAGNIFLQGKFPETVIEEIIRDEIEKYRIQFEDSEEGFIKYWPNSYEIRGWLVCMQSGGKLAAHIHDSGWITGSIYINVPLKSEINSGNLVLRVFDEEGDFEPEQNQERIVDVSTGSLCFFPSSLYHYTIPFRENEDRIVLAFDVIPKN